jgi:serine/threonine-protein kinase
MSETPDLEKTVAMTPGENDWLTVAPVGEASSVGGGGGESILKSLGRVVPNLPRVLLRDGGSGSTEPIVRVQSGELPEGGVGTRYQLHGEIARGGMGAILKGRDTDLGRDLAIKVLLDSHKDKPEVIQRFIEEAQISGQLQHPGIVPVYDLGQFSDQRPFFTMKLIKGKTLSAILEARKQPADDRARLLGIFEQVCQTMAYAHSRGVIHRDLKPANIMVGAFGEVQVMDWGLAKVMAEGGVADERKSRTAVSVIRTVRTVGSETPCSVGSDTVMGSVLGTPGYMAPEQARGEMDLVDERADVFGLGAILCQVLTGSPPFTGSGPEAMRKAQTASLDEAHQLLDNSGVDAALIAITKRCLAAEPWHRPRNAGMLAGEISHYMESVADRLHQAELDRLEAKTRVAEERKRRRVTLALAASVLFTCLIAGSGWVWVQQQQASHARELAEAARIEAVRETELANARVAAAEAQSRRQREQEEERSKLAQQINNALSDAESLRTKVETAGEADHAPLVQALAAARRAEALLGTGPVIPELSEQARNLVVELESQDKGRRLLAAANQARLASSDAENDQDQDLSRRALEAAFVEYGFPAADTDPAEFGRWIRLHPPAVRDGLIAALDYWKLIGGQPADWISSVLSAADNDPWRARLREAQSGDRALLIELANDPMAVEQPASAVHLARSLMVTRPPAPAESVALLQRAQERHPADFWINYWLASELNHHSLNKPSEAIPYAMIAVSIAPKSRFAHCALGKVLASQGRRDKAIAAFRTALDLDPKHTSSHHHLADALAQQGRFGEAYGEYELVIAEYRRTIEANPQSAITFYNLAQCLKGQGKTDEAIEAYRTSIQLDPEYTLAYANLAPTLESRAQWEQAIEAYRAAVRLEPQVANRHQNLAAALERRNRLDEAAEVYRAAIRLEPNVGFRYSSLGTVLMNQNKLDEAVAEYRKAIELDPRRATSHRNLGIVLARQGKTDEAVEAQRKAAGLDPSYASAHYNLGLGLVIQGKYEDAVRAHRTATELDPKNAIYHHGLGSALERQAKWEQAADAFRTATRIEPTAQRHSSLGYNLANHGKLDEAIAEHRKAIELDPKRGLSHRNFGLALAKQGKPAEAVEAYRRAIDLSPKYAATYPSLGLALTELGRLEEAVAAYRTYVQLNPKDAFAFTKLGDVLDKLGRSEEAREAYRHAVSIDPKHAASHYDIAQRLKGQQKLAEAVEEFRTAIKLNPNHGSSHYNLGLVLETQGKLDEAIECYKAARQLSPSFGCPNHSLAVALARQGKLDEAVESARTAINLDPRHAPSHHALGYSLEMHSKLDEAIAAYRAAIELDASYTEPQHRLADVLKQQGRFGEALEVLERIQTLAAKDTNASYTAQRAVEKMRRLVDLEAKLPDVIEGLISPAGPPEQIEYAELCYYKQLFLASARFWADAFLADSSLAKAHRYNAACNAALAGSGQGDGATLDAGQRGLWRKQALEWLQDELTAKTSQLETAKREDLPRLLNDVRHWLQDRDFNGIRHADEVAKLPADERDSLTRFWADVESLRQKTEQRLKQ